MGRLLAGALTIAACWAPCAAALAQTPAFTIEPYLQHVTTTSVQVSWETGRREGSEVEWGNTRQLGRRVAGLAVPSAGRRLHGVTLTGLTPATRYFYRVRMGKVVTPTFDLRTLPLARSGANLRFVLLSDTQKDRSRPQVLRELVHEGIMPLLTEARRARGDAPAVVLLPGDLVQYGGRPDMWRDLFRTLAPLSRHVAIFPVAGNHEEDSAHYFRYFALPANGSAKHAERWWWADFGNVRVVGLDSNEPYRTHEQLRWLARTLRSACEAEHVDFVFVQHHHPARSELWPKGDLPYSQIVALALEGFSTHCHKPSAIFTGHTHAYSRGHSRDHAVTFVQTASAGGELDRIGEYASRNYTEYVTSQDEYGFVIVDVKAGRDPSFRVRRISRGNPDRARDNELTDEVFVRRHSQPPQQPVATRPRGDLVDPNDVVLTSSAFVDRDGDAYGATRWQLAGEGCDFTNPLLDRWYQREPADVEDTVLRRERGENYLRLPALPSNTAYCYRTRVRDGSLSWSAWSEPTRFRTLASLQSDGDVHARDQPPRRANSVTSRPTAQRRQRRATVRARFASRASRNARAAPPSGAASDCKGQNCLAAFLL